MPGEIILQAEHICKSFAGNKAVDDVSISLERGKITGLIGANGAGKTTFFNCLTSYHPYFEGTIIYNGQKLHRQSPYKLCKMGIARTFQIAKPFGGMTVMENTLVGAVNKYKKKWEAYESAKQSLEFSGLADKAGEYAYDLNTGDQRRLELARALATKPELLLLDEVMAGLTPSESSEMTGLIRKINASGVTILMIEHIMPVVMSLSDIIYVLERGKLISYGTPNRVASDPKVISSYLGGAVNVRT